MPTRSGRPFSRNTESNMANPTTAELQTLITGLQNQVVALQNAASAQPAPPVVTTPSVTFQANPFSADINPCTSSGLKLFTAATAERKESDKLSAKISCNIKFIESLRDDAASFGWGSLIGSIEVNSNDYHILKDFKVLKLLHVRN
mmetsp:Transcript_20197/g.24891  ORF Transcript_20197/g.24891 Transcript_20197/m.24891 type:complete len:146 (-) Transcript_20197:97-534(-)